MLANLWAGVTVILGDGPLPRRIWIASHSEIKRSDGDPPVGEELADLDGVGGELANSGTSWGIATMEAADGKGVVHRDSERGVWVSADRAPDPPGVMSPSRE